jgi:hypothetical protein
LRGRRPRRDRLAGQTVDTEPAQCHAPEPGLQIPREETSDPDFSLESSFFPLTTNSSCQSDHVREVVSASSARTSGKSIAPFSRQLPAGTINTADDSRLVKTFGQKAVQGYNAQAAVSERQILVAAEVTVESPDFGHLEPMVDATERELERAGAESPKVVIADADYWHKRQMESVVCRGIQVLIPPDSGLRTSARPGWDGGLYAFMRRVRNRPRQGALPKAPRDGRAGVRTDEVQPTLRPLLTTRKIGRPLGVAAVRGEPQAAQAPEPPDSRRRELNPATRRPSFRSERSPRRTAHPTQPPFPDSLRRTQRSESAGA